MPFKLDLNLVHARVLRESLDIGARLGMGQFDELIGLHNLKHEVSSDTAWQAQLDAHRLHQAITGLEVGTYHGITSTEIHDDFRVAWDLMQGVRHFMARQAGIESFDPQPLSREEPPARFAASETSGMTLELSRRQAQVVVQATDLYARMGMGQFEELLMALKRKGQFQGPIMGDAYEACCALKHSLMGLSKSGSFGIGSPRIHDDFRVAWDLMQITRHALALSRLPQGDMTVDFDIPEAYSDTHPLATVSAVGVDRPGRGNQESVSYDRQY